MSEILQKRKLSSFLTQVRRQEILEDDKVYRLLGVKWYGKGVFIREEKKGKEIKAEKLFRVKTGDFIYNRLFAWKSSFAIITEEFSDCLVSNEFPIFNLKDDSVDLEYLLKFILLPPNIDTVNRLSGGMSSVSRKRFKEEEFLNFEIPNVTKKEQHKISSYISGIENKVHIFLTETESQSEYLSSLRQAILQEAVEGKLTADWRKAHPELISGENHASRLLEKIKAEKEHLIKEGKIKKEKPLPWIKNNEKVNELPEGWVWGSLQDISDVRDGTHDTPQYFQKGIPFITSKNLENNKINFDKCKYISIEDHKKYSNRSHVDKNDIIFAMIGSIGNPVIVEVDFEFSIKNVALFKYYDHSLIESKYLYYYLLFSQEKIKQMALGGLQPFVSLKFIRNYIICLPPLIEQQVIAKKIDRLIDMVDELEKQVQERKELADMLMQSVLREAFEGQT